MGTFQDVTVSSLEERHHISQSLLLSKLPMPTMSWPATELNSFQIQKCLRYQLPLVSGRPKDDVSPPHTVNIISDHFQQILTARAGYMRPGRSENLCRCAVAAEGRAVLVEATEGIPPDSGDTSSPAVWQLSV